jgi:hypothetical protein
MKGDRKYIFILVSLTVIMVLVQLFSPKPINWTPTYLPNDKAPFGAYVTDRLFTGFFDTELIKNNLTFYEFADTLPDHVNIISISDAFEPDPSATKVLLDKVANGANAFISANRFGGTFRDTLGLFTQDVYFGGLAQPMNDQKDTTDLKIISPISKKRGYYYELSNVSFFFSTDSLFLPAFIISTNAWNKPVTLRIPWGEGSILLNCTPLVFTNNYLLEKDNYEYAALTLSGLPKQTTWWTSYYQVGRLENQSELRYILSVESLRWAYYLAIIGLLLFILFEIKRRQRIIPIVRPPQNTTLQFVGTISNMYFQARDHKAIAEKQITFFIDQARTRYYLPTELNDSFLESLAKKSNVPLEDTRKLFTLIQFIHQSYGISEHTLWDLNQQLEKFK